MANMGYLYGLLFLTKSLGLEIFYLIESKLSTSEIGSWLYSINPAQSIEFFGVAFIWQFVDEKFNVPHVIETMQSSP